MYSDARRLAEAKSQYHDMVTSKLTAAAPSLDVPGLGDEAHRLGPMIYVRKGSTIYVFTMIAKDGNGAGATRTIALAKSSIARLH
jgi:acyl-CoA reductase-like NAD-dependent aldehyde dehydrogenase